MKRIKLLLFICIIGGAFFIFQERDIKLAEWMLGSGPVKVEGKAVVLVDENTGETLFAKNKNEKKYPASTTKLLTALVVLDKASPEEKVQVGNEIRMSREGEARAGLFEGQVQTVEELLAAMLLQSGNDAARTLAVYTAGKEYGHALSTDQAMTAFAELMNKKGMELGLKGSHFTNPHGLHDPKHFSTAEDLAAIAHAAITNGQIRGIVNRETYSTMTHTYSNRNRLMVRDSPYYFSSATGMKTGFTDEAGYCLISSAEAGGKQVIAVVLDSGKDSVYTDTISMLNYGLNR
ncbi:MAG TPA: serine hydrolase [Bacillaceae bacterium]